MIQNKFFSAELIAPKTWRITNCFDSHAHMTTYSYLLEGGERAMLIDTMFGYGNLRAFCRELTDRKPPVKIAGHIEYSLVNIIARLRGLTADRKK